MKVIRIAFFSIICLFLGNYLLIAQDKEAPRFNAGIVNYVTSVMGKQVARGECWDLAKEALDKYQAQWDGSFNFGREYDPQKEPTFAGDIIQFWDVTFKYTKKDVTYTETMKQHTAIVYKVLESGVFIIAHQNTSNGGRKVTTQELRLKDLNAGKLQFYRPIPPN